MLRPGFRSCPLGSHRTGLLRCRRCRYSTSRLLSVARIVSAQSGWSESSEERYTLAHTSVDPDRKGRPMPFTWMRVVAGTLFWVLFAQPGGTQQATAQRTGAYWAGEGGNPPRIIFAAGRRLIALNARTGTLDSAFGRDGEVDMVVPYNSVPLVYRNVVVVGANNPPGSAGAIGNARAFDARTG